MSETKKKNQYSPPLIFDLGTTEGVGVCVNGTGVWSCSSGAEDMDDCANGRYASNSCNSGGRYVGSCLSGFEASKRNDAPVKRHNRFL